MNSIYNNADTLRASYDAMSSAAKAVANVPDLPKNEYSSKAQDMGAGRYDNIKLSDDYKKAVENGLVEDWDTNPEYDSVSVLMNVLSDGSGLEVLPEAMMNANYISFVHDVQVAAMDIQLKMIDETIKSMYSANKSNASSYFS